MKRYTKILALDFEMFNAFHYWSICWTGAALAGEDMLPVYFLDRKIDPGIRQQITGSSIRFPFTYEELRKCPRFFRCCKELFRLIDEDTLVLGHAVDNDVKMLLTVCARYHLKCPDFDFLDTNVLYGALHGEYVQIGLAALAQTYGVVYDAHNPVEDAAATLEVCRRMLEEKGMRLCEAAETYGITVGEVRKKLMKKCTADCMGERARRHIDNYNAVFEAANAPVAIEGQQLAGKKIAVENKLSVSQNLFPLIVFLRSMGAKIVYDTSVADMVVTAEIGKRDANSVNLRELALCYGLPREQAETLDFYPNKVTDESGEMLPYMEYLRRKYGRSGQTASRCYCFVHALEKRLEFEDIAKRLLESGGRLSGLMSENTVLVTDDVLRIETDVTDMKVRGYKHLRNKQGKLITLKELFRRMEEKSL